MVKQKKGQKNKNKSKSKSKGKKDVCYSEVVWLLDEQLSRVFEGMEPQSSWRELYFRLIDAVVKIVVKKEDLSSEGELEQYVATHVDKDAVFEGKKLSANYILKKLENYVKETYPARLKEFVKMWIDPAGYSMEGFAMVLDPFSENLAELHEWLVDGAVKEGHGIKFDELQGVYNPNDADTRDAQELVDVLRANGVCTETNIQLEANPLAMVGQLFRLNGLFKTYSHLKRRQRALKNLRDPVDSNPLSDFFSLANGRDGYDLFIPEEGVFGHNKSGSTDVKRLEGPIDEEINWIVAIVPDRQGAYYRARKVDRLKEEVAADPETFERKHLPEAINGDEMDAKFFACYHYEIGSGDNMTIKTADEWDCEVEFSQLGKLAFFELLDEIPQFAGADILHDLKRQVYTRPSHESERKIYHNSDRFFDEFATLLKDQYGTDAMYVFGDGTDNPHPSTEKTMILQAWISGLQTRGLKASFVNDKGISLVCSTCIYPTIERRDSRGKTSQHYCANPNCGKQGRECVCACECADDDCKQPGEPKACVTRHCPTGGCESITGSPQWDNKAHYISSNLIYLTINLLLGKERPQAFTHHEAPLTARDIAVTIMH
ncbi:hypothetical protein TRICI_003344 [Trichomonascus ciferrii]|uniref:Uncharacterized protein n=1 Tax=Trichomonascus ciferrii TaxID=44093 RepID=A0A642V429_9ASCO|nr:hypothetical protein TRICI_003344 [Trichomonascus ciferrii]